MNIARAMLKLLGENVPWSCGESYESIIMGDSTPKPTLAALEAAWVQAQADDESARLAEIAAQADRQQIKQVISAMNAGTGTNAERITRIEKVLYRVVVDLYK